MAAELGISLSAVILLAASVAAVGQTLPEKQRNEAGQIARDARLHYVINCQGCHKSDGSGQPGFIPPLRGSIGRFLTTDDGRAYLTRVPGVAQSTLSDRELADVLNWTLLNFDRANLPTEFRPYSPEEVRAGREKPLSDTIKVRQAIVRSLDHIAQ